MITADLDGRGRVSLSDFAAMEETATPQLLATQPQKRAPSPVSHEKNRPQKSRTKVRSDCFRPPAQLI